ncbi:MAG: FAD-dependent oxidoreductase [Candidatus Limnocylindrales bacterium]
MAAPESFDAVVLGAGEAGALLASYAVAAGHRVAMVYREPYGSTCVNVGCVPSKFLIARARVAQTMRTASRFGIGAVEPAIDLPRIVAEKQAMVSDHRSEGLESAKRAERVTLLEGPAHFVSPTEVEVGGRRLTAPKMFIATGMRPDIPPIAGLADVTYYTNENIMDLTEAPRHLIVLGGGYIGAELGQVYHRFGAEVTVISRNPRLVPEEEPETSAALAQGFAAEGLQLMLGREAERVEATTDGIRVWAGTEAFEGSHLLVATGRRPNTDELNLEAAGLVLGDGGVIPVDARMRTTVEGIWAIGDVNGEQPFTRVCQEEAKVAFADAFGDGHPGLERRSLGHAIFTDPEIGSVGLTEAQARAKGLDALAGTVGLDQVEKAELIGETRGVIKVVAERGTRRLLGLHIAGPAAADLVYDGALVLRRRGTVDEIAATIGIFPTLQEGVEGTARAVLRSLGVAGGGGSVGAHDEGGNLACPACAAGYELRPKTEAPEATAGSLACPACAAEYDITTSMPEAPIRSLDAPADSFACPSCAAELQAVVT